jgi:hypothetical protein
VGEVTTSYQTRLLSLGKQPPWWRPLKRRAWRRALHAILSEAIRESAQQIAARYWEAMSVGERFRQEEVN